MDWCNKGAKKRWCMQTRWQRKSNSGKRAFWLLAFWSRFDVERRRRSSDGAGDNWLDIISEDDHEASSLIRLDIEQSNLLYACCLHTQKQGTAFRQKDVGHFDIEQRFFFFFSGWKAEQGGWLDHCQNDPSSENNSWAHLQWNMDTPNFSETN